MGGFVLVARFAYPGVQVCGLASPFGAEGTAEKEAVTIGNIVGGAIFVGSIYWWVYMRTGKRKELSHLK